MILTERICEHQSALHRGNWSLIRTNLLQRFLWPLSNLLSTTIQATVQQSKEVYGKGDVIQEKRRRAIRKMLRRSSRVSQSIWLTSESLSRSSEVFVSASLFTPC